MNSLGRVLTRISFDLEDISTQGRDVIDYVSRNPAIVKQGTIKPAAVTLTQVVYRLSIKNVLLRVEYSMQNTALSKPNGVG